MDKTIDMAEEAGAISYWHLSRLKAFEELVRADEREQGQKWFDAVTAQHKQEILAEREACHALRQTLPNPYEHCQVSAHAYDMAIAAYAAAIRNRGNT